MNKHLHYLKNTLLCLFPVPVVTVGLKYLSDLSSPSAQLSLGHYRSIEFLNRPNSIKKLSSELDSNRNFSTSASVDDLGSTLIYKPNEFSPSYKIEQHLPFSHKYFHDEFSFKKGRVEDMNSPNTLSLSPSPPSPSASSSNIDSNIKFTKVSETSKDRYELNLEDFKNSSIKDKSDLHIIFEYGLKVTPTTPPIPSPVEHIIPLIASVPLYFLLHSSNFDSPLISLEKIPSSLTLTSSSTQPSSTEETKTYYLSLSKNQTTKKISVYVKEYENKKEKKASDIEIKSFYILFTDNPSLDQELYFIDNANAINIDRLRKGKKTFLEKWSPSSSPESKDPKYSFKENKWHSICWDPYKAGGFIDKDLTKREPPTPDKKQTTTQKSFIKKQKEQVELFQPQLIHPTIKTQYTWAWGSGVNNVGDYHPIIQHTTPTPCEGVDKDTYNLLKKYVNDQEHFESNTQSKPQVLKTLAPRQVLDMFSEENISNPQKDYKTSNSKDYRIVQGSFIPFGGVYATSQDGNQRHIKSNTLFNQEYVDSITSQHTYSFQIDKNTWKKHLVEHELLKKENLQTNPKVSTVLTLEVPLAFQIYDPASNYLNKERLNLSVDLDLRSLFESNRITIPFYTYSISDYHKKVGEDWGGYKINGSVLSNKRPFGYRGKVIFSATLERDLKQNFTISISAKISGFISTKNPTCDLRHRLFIIHDSDTKQQKCTSTEGWTYRKHNHMPPLFIFNIGSNLNVNSWILDRREIGEKPITDYQNSLHKLTISNTWNTIQGIDINQNQNSEVYYENINAADPSTREDSKKFTEIASYNQYKTIQIFSTYWYAYYYIPRKNYGSININTDEDLDEITLTLEGSSSLSGKFFDSFHHNTSLTYCTSKNSSELEFSKTKECGDGQKYEEQKTDVDYSTFSSDLNYLEVYTSFEKLKEKTDESNSLRFDFLTLIHREKPKSTSDKFLSQKSRYEEIFSEAKSPSYMNKSQTVAEHSHIGAWYSINLWWDKPNLTLNYSTYLRTISVLSGVKDWKDSASENQTTHKLPGSAGAAGFQVSKTTLKYKLKT